MSENDLEEQINELLAIQEICGDENVHLWAKSPDNYESLSTSQNEDFFANFPIDCSIGGLIEVSPAITDQLKISWTDEKSQTHEFSVSYLTPVKIRFAHPKNYPSKSCTYFQLECSWLTPEAIGKIQRKFEQVWTDNQQNVILFSWISEIKDECFDTLQISDGSLCLDPTLLKLDQIQTKEAKADSIDKEEVDFSREYKGILDRYMVQKGFGFIYCPALHLQCFVHRTNMNFHFNGITVVTFFLKRKNSAQFEAIKVSKKSEKQLESCDLSTRYQGTLDLSFWNFLKKYGFIYTPELDADLFVKENELKFKPSEHNHHIPVEFTIKETRRHFYEAVQVIKLQDPLQKEEGSEIPRVRQVPEAQKLIEPDLVKTLKAFNESEEQRAFASQIFSCKVCFAERSGKSCLKFAECGHIFCNDCMRSYFEVQIKEGQMSSLICPEDKCKSQALPNQVKSLVSEKSFKLYEDVLLSTTLETMADVILCPRRHCQCPTLIDRDANMGQCPNPKCSYVFCIYCNASFHGVAPCRVKSVEQRALITKYMGADGSEKELMEKRYGKRQLQTMVNNMLSETYLSENTKPCPKCQAPIQKSEGCNKMTCNKCGTYFCYICGAKLPNENPYSHFSSPVGDCYNLLFEGVDRLDGEFQFIEDEEDEEDNFVIF